MAKYVVHYGCYLSMITSLVETDMTKEQVERNTYEAAYQETSNWEGQHGFLEESELEEAEEEGCDINDYIREAMEDACEYWVEDYNPEVHDISDMDKETW